MILITGSSGSIGEIILMKLSKLYKCRSLSRKKLKNTYSNVEYFTGEFNDKKFLSQAFEDVKVVIHLAAETRSNNINKIYNSNVLLTSNMLEIMIEKKIQFLYFTSSILEETCLSHYSRSKLKCSELINSHNQAFFKSYRVPPVFDDITINKSSFTINILKDFINNSPIFLSPIKPNQKIPFIRISKLISHIIYFIDCSENIPFKKNIPDLSTEFITLKELKNQKKIIIYFPFFQFIYKNTIKVFQSLRIPISPSLETLWYILG